MDEYRPFANLSFQRLRKFRMSYALLTLSLAMGTTSSFVIFNTESGWASQVGAGVGVVALMMMFRLFRALMTVQLEIEERSE
jgi:hypothetical protein